MNLDIIVYGNVTTIQLLKAALIIIIAVLIAKGLAIYLRRMLKAKVEKHQLELIVKIVWWCIIIIAMLTVLPILGIDPTGLLVAACLMSVAIGYASKSVVGNLIAGIFMLIERPIKIGESVNIGGMAGIVLDIRLFSTTLRAFDGLYVRVPNEKAFTDKMINYNTHLARRFEYVVGIRFCDDADKAIALIKNLIEEHPLALKNPAAQVFVDNLGDNSVDINVRIWAPTTEWFGVKMELLWQIKNALENEGIQFPFPQRELWFNNELRSRDIEAE